MVQPTEDTLRGDTLLCSCLPISPLLAFTIFALPVLHLLCCFIQGVFYRVRNIYLADHQESSFILR